jgi:hypothetical protein
MSISCLIPIKRSPNHACDVPSNDPEGSEPLNLAAMHSCLLDRFLLPLIYCGWHFHMCFPFRNINPVQYFSFASYPRRAFLTRQFALSPVLHFYHANVNDTLFTLNHD